MPLGHRFGLVVPAALAAALVLGGSLAGRDAARAAPPPGPFKFNGAKSCGGSGCHDSKLTELPTWQKDPHSKAQTRLVILKRDEKSAKKWTASQKLTAAMEKALKIKDASKDKACLSCHGVAVAPPTSLAPGEIVSLTPALKEATFAIGDGVSCDTCHGPSSAWLDPHDAAGWAVKEWAKLPESATASRSNAMYEQHGLYYSKDVVLWARQCVRCHLAIDAELLEAKHPPLEPFELVFQSNEMRTPAPTVKPHWRDYATEKADEAGLPAPGPFHGVRMWQTGQAVAVHVAALQVVERAAGKTKAAKKYLGDGAARTAAHFEVVRPAIEKVDPDAAKKLAAAMDAMRKAFAAPGTPTADIAQAASAVADITDPGRPASLAKKLADQKVDADGAKAILRAVATIAVDKGRKPDEAARLAEQMGLGLRTLFASYADGVKLADAARKPVADAIEGMAKKTEKAEKGEFKLDFLPASEGFKKGAAAAAEAGK